MLSLGMQRGQAVLRTPGDLTQQISVASSLRNVIKHAGQHAADKYLARRAFLCYRNIFSRTGLRERNMQIRRMGTTGLKVSEICLGTMTFGHQCDQRTSFAILDKAAAHGVTFLDTADVYPVPPSPETAGRSEEIIGRWLKGKRDKFVLATKCRMRVGHGPNDEGLSRKHILKAAEDSLRRLQTDYVDLYQAHSPDSDSPLEETLEALDSLVRQGKVRYV